MRAFTGARDIHAFAWSSRGSEHNADLKVQDNQDMCFVERGDGYVAFGVCDGCSQSLQAKVGSVLAAGLIRTSLAMRVPGLTSIKQRERNRDARTAFALRLARLVRSDVLDGLREIVFLTVGDSQKAANDFVTSHLLCTMLIGVISDDTVVLMGLGDGAFEVNGDLTIIAPEEERMPPYLAYALLDDPRWHTNFEIYAIRELKNVNSVGVFTDGVLYLAAAAGWQLSSGAHKVPSWHLARDGQTPGLPGRWLTECCLDREQAAVKVGDGSVLVGSITRAAYLKDDCTGARAIIEH